MRLFALLVLTGCGRFGFEAQPGTVTPDAACGRETCNGLDDNCDGLVDEGCPCTPFDVTFASDLDDAPGIVWTGTSYVVLARVGAAHSLVEVAQDGTVTPAPDDAGFVVEARDTIAWTGTSIVVAHTEGGTVMLGDTVIGTGTNAHVIWDRDRLVAAWNASDQTLRLGEFDRDGTALAPEIAISVVMNIEAVAATSRFWILAARDAADFYAVLVPREGGAPIMHALEIAMFGGYGNIAVANDTAIVLQRRTPSAPEFRIIDGDGNLASAVLTVPPIGPMGEMWYASVASTGTSFRVVGMTRDTMHELYGVELATDGTPGTAESWLTYFGNPWGANTVAAAAGRAACAFPHNDGTAQITRVVQRCR